MTCDLDDTLSHGECRTKCSCDRGGYYLKCQFTSCYDCFLDRRSDYLACIFCGRWHSPSFDHCFKCKPESRGRDDAAVALRQLIMHRDAYACQQCGIRAGELQADPRNELTGTRHAALHVDHVVPCAAGGTADEWNLQVLCSACNYRKGSIWYPGCSYDTVRTALCRKYALIAGRYFPTDELARFRAEMQMFRATGTWDPATHRAMQFAGGVSA